MDQSRHEFLVEGTWESLGEEVGQVELTSEVCDGELALPNAIAQPVEAHVDTLGFFLFDGVGGESDGELVITKDGSGRLDVAKGGRDGAQRYALLSEQESCAVFRLPS